MVYIIKSNLFKNVTLKRTLTVWWQMNTLTKHELTPHTNSFTWHNHNVITS